MKRMKIGPGYPTVTTREMDAAEAWWCALEQRHFRMDHRTTYDTFPLACRHCEIRYGAACPSSVIAQHLELRHGITDLT